MSKRTQTEQAVSKKLIPEIDRTPHDLDRHITQPKVHTRAWYAFWGHKCPVCGEPAQIGEA